MAGWISPTLNHHPSFGGATQGMLRAGVSGESAGSAHSELH
jgi:hypothetical protein